jgi:hypothetical protein
LVTEISSISKQNRAVYLVTEMSSTEEFPTAMSGMFLHITFTWMGKVVGRAGGNEVASLLSAILHSWEHKLRCNYKNHLK